MRTVVLATELGPHGGVQRYGQRIVDTLIAHGHDLTVLQSADWPSAAARARGMIAYARALHEADLTWVLHPRLAPTAIPPARLRRVPSVVSTYGFENWGAFPLTWRKALGRATTVTAISRFSAAMMGDPGRNAELLRPTWGVDTSAPSPRPLSGRDIVLLVTRLDEPYKGIDLLADLARRNSDHPAPRFVVAGSGTPVLPENGLPSNVELVVEPDDSELAELYRRAVAVILPSRTTRLHHNRWTGGEGFGIVLLEAALAGAPVIASDEGACPETVALLGNGFCCPVQVSAFDAILKRLLQDGELWNALSSSGIASAQDLSPERFAERVAQVVSLATAGGVVHR